MPTLSERASSARVCYLATTGRVTGRPHEIEIWFATEPDTVSTIYLLSGGRHRADWVRNIRHDPAVFVRAGDGRYRGTARILTPDDAADRRAREIVAAKYQGWQPGQPFSQWARDSLAIAIELEGPLK